MEPFFALFCAMGVSTMFFDNWNDNFDIIGSLPLEVAIIILRKLDPKSLLAAVQVSRKWLSIVKSDRILKQTLKNEFARQKQEKLEQGTFLYRSITQARFSAMPYNKPPSLKKPTRKFESSVKMVDKPKKRKTWVSSLSTNQIRKMR